MARINSLKMGKSSKQKNLLASKDIWKDAGVDISPDLRKTLEGRGEKPTDYTEMNRSGIQGGSRIPKT